MNLAIRYIMNVSHGLGGQDDGYRISEMGQLMTHL